MNYNREKLKQSFFSAISLFCFFWYEAITFFFFDKRENDITEKIKVIQQLKGKGLNS